jgi:hypothetical protein
MRIELQLSFNSQKLSSPLMHVNFELVQILRILVDESFCYARGDIYANELSLANFHQLSSWFNLPRFNVDRFSV